MVNRLVEVVLASPARRVLCGSTAVLRYVGRRSGRTVTIPAQYARHGDGLLIMAARPETKQWWRNFIEVRDLDVLLDGRWVPMRGQARRGRSDPQGTASLLAVYLARFPRAARALPDDPADRVRSAVLVECRPR